VLVPHVGSKIIRPLDPLRSNAGTPFNWTTHTVAEVHGVVVPIQGLLGLKGSRPRAIWGFAGKSGWGTCMRATKGVMGTC